MGSHVAAYREGVATSEAYRCLPTIAHSHHCSRAPSRLQWFGVDENSMSKVLPNLENFPAEQLIAQDSLYKKSSVAFVQLLEGVGANLDSLNAEGRAGNVI